MLASGNEEADRYSASLLGSDGLFDYFYPLTLELFLEEFDVLRPHGREMRNLQISVLALFVPIVIVAASAWSETEYVRTPLLIASAVTLILVVLLEINIRRFKRGCGERRENSSKNNEGIDRCAMVARRSLGRFDGLSSVLLREDTVRCCESRCRWVNG